MKIQWDWLSELLVLTPALLALIVVYNAHRDPEPKDKKKK